MTKKPEQVESSSPPKRGIGFFSRKPKPKSTNSPATTATATNTATTTNGVLPPKSPVQEEVTVGDRKASSNAEYDNEMDRLRAELAEMQLKNFHLEESLKKNEFQIYELKTKLESTTQMMKHGAEANARTDNTLSLVGEEQDSVSGRGESLDESEISSHSKRTSATAGMKSQNSRPSLLNSMGQTSGRRLSSMNLQGGIVRRGKTMDVGSRNIAKMLSEHLQKQVESRQEASKSVSGSSKNLTDPAVTSADSSNRKHSARKPQNRSASFLRKMLAHKSNARAASSSAASTSAVSALSRGGVQVATSIGAIQFGMPPETVKDSMESGMPVPSIFVVPPERFNLHEGVNVSEIEFPAFFNFFVLKKKIRLVTYRDNVEDLKAIMQEALLGPEPEYLFVEDEYSKFVSPEVFDARPDLEKEIAYFQAPRAPDFYQIDTNNLIQFEFFDDKGFIDLGNGVKIIDDGDEGYEIIDSGKAEADGTPAEPVYISYDQASSCLSVPPSMKKGAESSIPASFAIPQFGVTVLGNSHGFDPEGSTSGFVVWVNGQGAMVDPPPHSSMLLTKAGIQPKFVTAIILTHCHADHEVGTIQKMVTEDKVTLMTTTTIFESFLRKYAAVSGLGTEFLRNLVHFRPVFLEEPTYWNGAAFRFFYSLHSIPCVGFEVKFASKSFVYSADTYYDVKGLEEMHKQGVLSAPRLKSLLNFPWDSDVVFHEMGVPPIHTPIEALEALPERQRKNIRLIHIGGKAARDAMKRGFKIATAGVEHTIVLKDPNEEENKVLKVLQLLSSMDIFRGFAVHQALELLFMATEARFKAGEHIVEKDTPGDKFLIIVRGSASVTFGGAKKIFSAGDYLGEISVITGATRTATVVAEVDVLALEVDRYAFDYLVMHDSTLKVRMENLIKSRSDGSWRAIAHNSLLSNLSASQKTQLQALLTLKALKRGDVVWKQGEEVKSGLLISKGGLRFEEVHGVLDKHSKAPKEENCPLSTGMFIFDMFGYMNGLNLTTTLICETDMALVFTFASEPMMEFLDLNPILMLAFLKNIVII